MSEAPRLFRVVYPAGITTVHDRLEHLAAVRETLRREHNIRGAAYRAGEITDAEWEAYVRQHRLRTGAVCEAVAEAMAEQRQQFMGLADNDARLATIDIEATIEEGPA